MSEDRILAIEKKLDRILTLLEDDKVMGKKGLGTRVNNLEYETITQQRKIDRIYWTAGIVAAFVALLVKLISSML